MNEEAIIPQIVESNNALESIERASIDMQISTAKKYPRVLSKVKTEMMSFATLDQETAASCFYSLPRGGKTIQDASVRLAEIAASCYGNIRTASRVIDTVTAGDNPHVVVQAVAHDLEKNVAISIEKRRRITKKKSKNTIDEDDIQLAANAAGSIAFRDAVFKVVPKALIRPVFLEAKKVAIGDIRSLASKRQETINRLLKMGLTEDRIFAVIDVKKIDDIDLEKLEILFGLGTSLKDGELSLEEAFPPIKPTIPTMTPKEPNPAPSTTEQPTPPQTHAPTEPAPTQPQAMTDYEKLVVMCDENGIKSIKIVDALKRLGQLPAKTSITTPNLTDEKLKWCIVPENFDKILANIEA